MTFNSSGKDPNHRFKVVGAINRQELSCGMVQCQAITMVYSLSSVVKR